MVKDNLNCKFEEENNEYVNLINPINKTRKNLPKVHLWLRNKVMEEKQCDKMIDKGEIDLLIKEKCSDKKYKNINVKECNENARIVLTYINKANNVKQSRNNGVIECTTNVSINRHLQLYTNDINHTAVAKFNIACYAYSCDNLILGWSLYMYKYAKTIVKDFLSHINTKHLLFYIDYYLKVKQSHKDACALQVYGNIAKNFKHQQTLSILQITNSTRENLKDKDDVDIKNKNINCNIKKQINSITGYSIDEITKRNTIYNRFYNKRKSKIQIITDSKENTDNYYNNASMMHNNTRQYNISYNDKNIKEQKLNGATVYNNIGNTNDKHVELRQRIVKFGSVKIKYF